MHRIQPRQHGGFELGSEASTGGTTAVKNIGSGRAEVFCGYRKGVAICTIAKGGLMHEAGVAGQKFDFKRTP